MTLFALVRHLPTAWNEEGRLQGRSDPPLAASAASRTWRLPSEFEGFRVLASPLRRAVDTARLFGVAAPEIEPRLVEMAWGEWEGSTLAELRKRLGAEMVTLEAQGLDFHPRGGESPRQVQQRVAPLLAEIAAVGRPSVAVTHKGVMRAVLALASGWDMRGDPPWRLSWTAAQLFRLGPDGQPAIERLNLELCTR
jgi:broad specificity phosphatase PhoE